MLRRVLGSCLAGAVALVLMAVPAAAHVKVDPSTATQGSYAVLTFRVPNEEQAADTVGLKVQIPTDHPLASVSVQPKPGWTHKARKAVLDKPITMHGSKVEEVVSEVDWSGGTIAPGEFDTFSLSVGPLPTDIDELVFKVIQQYRKADGTTSEVAWIQLAGPDGAEPDHPAPVLELTAAADAAGPAVHGATTVPGVTVSSAGKSGGNAVATDAATQSSVTSVLAIAVAALVIAVAALVLALARKNRGATG